MDKKKDLPELKDIKFDQLADMQLTTKQNMHIRNFILNQQPFDKWIAVKQGVKYMAIDKVEYLLTVLFGDWRVEVKEVKQVLNSMVTTIRLHYWNESKQAYDWQDGIGAQPIQTASGKSSMAFEFVTNDAIQKAAPSSESYAVKDAADKIGRIFGRDLNRKNIISYNSEGEKFKDLLA